MIDTKVDVSVASVERVSSVCIESNFHWRPLSAAVIRAYPSVDQSPDRVSHTMDSAIDLSNADSALDLANIRFQLM